MYRILALAVVALAAFHAYAAELPVLPQPRSLSASDLPHFLRAMRDVTIVLDVRTKGEYGRGHIAGAKHLDWYEDAGFWKKLKKYEPLQGKKVFVVYCHDGGRSKLAVDQMRELGYAEVVHVDGGAVAMPRRMLTYPRKVAPPTMSYR